MHSCEPSSLAELRRKKAKQTQKFPCDFPFFYTFSFFFFPSKMVVVVKGWIFPFFAVRTFLIAQSEKAFNDFHSYCDVCRVVTFFACYFGTFGKHKTYDFNFQLLFQHFIYEIVIEFISLSLFFHLFCLCFFGELLRKFTTFLNFSLSL